MLRWWSTLFRWLPHNISWCDKDLTNERCICSAKVIKRCWIRKHIKSKHTLWWKRLTPNNFCSRQNRIATQEWLNAGLGVRMDWALCLVRWLEHDKRHPSWPSFLLLQSQDDQWLRTMRALQPRALYRGSLYTGPIYMGPYIYIYIYRAPIYSVPKNIGHRYIYRASIYIYM